MMPDFGARQRLGWHHGTGARDPMTTIGEKIGGFWHKFATLLGARRDKAPVDSVAALEDFVSTRSAYVAQKTLYGYVKTRMGMRYVAMFEDKNIIASLNIAKLHVFAACLSDLTIYAVATALFNYPVGNEERAALARRFFTQALAANIGEAAQFPVQDTIDEFERRLGATDWQHGARGPDIFTKSPPALVRWAPIEDKLKRLDREIVENSVKFAWRDIRVQLQKRLDAAAVGADWTQAAGG
jgi:hypothetical protein